MFRVLRSVYVLCFTFCFVFCVVYIFCNLILIFVLSLLYVHLHYLFAGMSHDATNSSDTDNAGKHKICRTRFARVCTCEKNITSMVKFRKHGFFPCDTSCTTSCNPFAKKGNRYLVFPNFVHVHVLSATTCTHETAKRVQKHETQKVELLISL